MSKPVYLYRAVTVREEKLRDDANGWTDYLPTRYPLGRSTGYLSRSAAVDAGRRSGLDFEIERSEPVEFLSGADKLRREIQRLTAELAAVEGVAS